MNHIRILALAGTALWGVDADDPDPDGGLGCTDHVDRVAVDHRRHDVRRRGVGGWCGCVARS
jgi:hypothetical protein